MLVEESVKRGSSPPQTWKGSSLLSTVKEVKRGGDLEVVNCVQQVHLEGELFLGNPTSAATPTKVHFHGLCNLSGWNLRKEP